MRGTLWCRHEDGDEEDLEEAEVKGQEGRGAAACRRGEGQRGVPSPA